MIDVAILMAHIRFEADMAFEKYVESLPPEQRAAVRAERNIERRHQELCQAIRDSRPRGLFC